LNRQDESKVQDHFYRKADEFDSIYEDDRDSVSRVLDGLFRKSVYARFELTLRKCGDVSGKKILDVGCGPGRYSVELAKRGAIVTGIDFAESMIVKARRLAESQGVSERSTFKTIDFKEMPADETYDICIGMGLFDYISQPGGTLEKMNQVTEEKVIASVPVKFSLLTPFRKIRLALKDCPVFFYEKSDIEGLLRSAGFDAFSIQKVYRDYFVTATPR
jgi:2-polyprenyl-3-methyl-5-hydroxy-6-metoxy-1,4-benzoquinol methylase